MAKKASVKSANKARMNLIQGEAKKLWATGKYKLYHQAVKQASTNLKNKVSFNKINLWRTNSPLF